MDIINQCYKYNNQRVKQLKCLIRNTNCFPNAQLFEKCKIYLLKKNAENINTVLSAMINDILHRSKINLTIHNIPYIAKLKHADVYEEITNVHIKDTIEEFDRVQYIFIHNKVAYVTVNSSSKARFIKSTLNNMELSGNIISVQSY